MTDLIISDITLMRPGYCVIGLEQIAANSFRSIRPLPPGRHAWPDQFIFRRGDRVRARLGPPARPRTPHMEDRQSTALVGAGNAVSQEVLVDSLRRAEVSDGLDGLYECELHSNTPNGNRWVINGQGRRSICGCKPESIRFSVYSHVGSKLKATISLTSNERLNYLPVVDREWDLFYQEIVALCNDSDNESEPTDILNQIAHDNVLNSDITFARIGLADAQVGDDKCWLMLDSLFPQPQKAWLDLL
jgi:hypothetical protein